jgi:malate synthase
MWDYAASILAILGHRPQFVLPDRHNYVNIGAAFMKAYYAKVIKTCHDHGALATGGMAAALYGSW